MIKTFMFRIVISIIVFTILKIKNVTSLPLLIFLLFLSDSLDCVSSPFPIDCISFYYQKNGEVVDLLMYTFFVTLFSNLFDDLTKKLLYGFILFRAIGVWKFYVTNDTKYLKYFPDFINSTLIAYAIYKQFSLSRDTYYILIIIGMIVKIIFEYKFHDKKRYR